MGDVRNSDLYQELRMLVAEILEIEPESINGDAGFVKDLGMDSMMALEILAAIEKKHKIVIPEDMMPQFTTLNKTVEIVDRFLSDQKQA